MKASQGLSEEIEDPSTVWWNFHTSSKISHMVATRFGHKVPSKVPMESKRMSGSSEREQKKNGENFE